MSIAVPTIVGTRAKMIGTIRSPLRSEYHPQNKVVKAATAPPGVDSIRVCFDLHNPLGEYFRQPSVAGNHARVPKPFDNQITDYIRISQVFVRREYGRGSLTVAQAPIRNTRYKQKYKYR